MGLFKKAKSLFGTSKSYERVEISGTKHLKGDGIQVPLQGLPLQICLGSDDNKLHLFPERLLKSRPEETPSGFVLFNSAHFFSRISGFVRLERGKKLVLGRSDPEQTAILSYSDKVNDRHLAVTYPDDALIFRDLHSDAGTTLSVLKAPEEIERLIRRRGEKLYQIRKIFGGPIRSLPLVEAQSDLEAVNRIMTQEVHRPINTSGRLGAVLKLPDEVTPILIGDLHVRIPVIGDVRVVHNTGHRAGHPGEHLAAVPVDHFRLAQPQKGLGAEIDGRDPPAAVCHEGADVQLVHDR